MAVNLLDLAKTYLNDDVVNRVSDMLDEKEQNTQKAFDGALPTLLSGLIQKSAEPGGTGSIMDLVAEVMAPNQAAGEVITPAGGILSHLEDLLTSKSQSGSLLSLGASIVQSLFSDKGEEIAGALSSYSGLKQSSASSVLNIAGPVLLSLLGRKLADDGTGISGLGSLLSSQTASGPSAVPSGLNALLAGIPGLGFLGGSGSTARGMTAAMDEPVPVNEPTPRVVTPIAVSDVPPARPAAMPAPAPVYTDDDNRASGSGNRWLPWLLLLLGAAALIYFLRSCGGDKDQTATTTTETTIDSTTSGLSAVADSTEETFEELTVKLGAFFKRKLPSGYELNIPELGIENNLVKFIEDESKPVDKTTWFNFDRLLFDTGKATLKPKSKEQVTNMAEILKAYPQVDLKLGGYTDNTGSADVNKKLSQDRADAVKAMLVELGIATARLDAEGYGPEYPVASNDTPQGRAQNRRIAVRVTKK